MTVARAQMAPEQQTLSIGGELDEAARRVIRALKADVEEWGGGLERLGEILNRDPAQLSRILDGKSANPPADLLAWAMKNGPNRRALAILSDVGGCVAPRPKPPAQPIHWFAAYGEVLDEMGIHEVVRDRARRLLPKYLEAQAEGA